MSTNPSPIPNSLTIKSQKPLDAKSIVLNFSELLDLGNQNEKAFNYYEGLIVYCQETKRRYEWRETTQEDGASGLITGGFTYPSNSVSHGITYTGRNFNFFPVPEMPDVSKFIKGAPDIKEIKRVPSKEDYLALRDTDQDEPGVLYIYPKPIS